MIEPNEEMERQSIITANLRLFLREKRITQKRVAAHLGFSEAWFSQIMKNKRSISVGELSKIAELLGIELADLCPRRGEVRPPNTVDEFLDRKILAFLDRRKKSK